MTKEINPIYDGDFQDDEWVAVASKKVGQRTRAEKIAYAKGPRRHPFVGEVYAEEVHLDDGPPRTRYFQSRDLAKTYKSKHETGDSKLRTKALKGGPLEEEPLDVVEPFVGPKAEPSAKNPAPVQAKIDRAGAVATTQRLDKDAKRP